MVVCGAFTHARLVRGEKGVGGGCGFEDRWVCNKGWVEGEGVEWGKELEMKLKR